MFGNDISEHRRVWRTNYPATIVMPGVVSKGEKIRPVCCRLTSAVYKDVSETNIIPFDKRTAKNSDYVFQQDGVPAPTEKDCRTDWKPTWDFGPKTFDPHSHQIKTTSISAYRRPLTKKLPRHATVTQLGSRLLWTAHGGGWGKALPRRTARAFNLE